MDNIERQNAWWFMMRLNGNAAALSLLLVVVLSMIGLVFYGIILFFLALPFALTMFVVSLIWLFIKPNKFLYTWGWLIAVAGAYVIAAPLANLFLILTQNTHPDIPFDTTFWTQPILILVIYIAAGFYLKKIDKKDL